MPGAREIIAGGAYVTLALKDADFKKGVEQAQAKIDSFSGSIKKLYTNFADISRVLIVGYAFTELYKTFANFEVKMRQVSMITRATIEETDKLTKKARKLGRETSYTTHEIADGMLMLSRLGFSSREVTEATEHVMNLARAAGDSLATAAQVAGSSMRAFQLDASQMSDITDVITATVNGAAMSLTDYAEAATKAAPTYSMLGRDIREMSAAIGVLGNMGIRGSLAGTALARALRRVADDDVQKILERYNVGFKDMKGNILPLSQIMKNLANATKGIPQDALLSLYEDLFEVRGATAAMALNVDPRSIDVFLAKLNACTDETERFALAVDESMFGQMKKFESAIEDTKIELGKLVAITFEPFNKPLRETITLLQSIMNSSNTLVRTFTNFSMVFGGIGLGIAGIAKSFDVIKSVMLPLTALNQLAMGKQEPQAPGVGRGNISVEERDENRKVGQQSLKALHAKEALQQAQEDYDKVLAENKIVTEKEQAVTKELEGRRQLERELRDKINALDSEESTIRSSKRLSDTEFDLYDNASGKELNESKKRARRQKRDYGSAKRRFVYLGKEIEKEQARQDEARRILDLAAQQQGYKDTIKTATDKLKALPKEIKTAEAVMTDAQSILDAEKEKLDKIVNNIGFAKTSKKGLKMKSPERAYLDEVIQRMEAEANEQQAAIARAKKLFTASRNDYKALVQQRERQEEIRRNARNNLENIGTQKIATVKAQSEFNDSGALLDKYTEERKQLDKLMSSLESERASELDKQNNISIQRGEKEDKKAQANLDYATRLNEIEQERLRIQQEINKLGSTNAMTPERRGALHDKGESDKLLKKRLTALEKAKADLEKEQKLLDEIQAANDKMFGRGDAQLMGINQQYLEKQQALKDAKADASIQAGVASNLKYQGKLVKQDLQSQREYVMQTRDANNLDTAEAEKKLAVLRQQKDEALALRKLALENNEINRRDVETLKQKLTAERARIEQELPAVKTSADLSSKQKKYKVRQLKNRARDIDQSFGVLDAALAQSNTGNTEAAAVYNAQAQALSEQIRIQEGIIRAGSQRVNAEKDLLNLLEQESAALDKDVAKEFAISRQKEASVANAKAQLQATMQQRAKLLSSLSAEQKLARKIAKGYGTYGMDITRNGKWVQQIKQVNAEQLRQALLYQAAMKNNGVVTKQMQASVDVLAFKIRAAATATSMLNTAWNFLKANAVTLALTGISLAWSAIAASIEKARKAQQAYVDDAKRMANDAADRSDANKSRLAEFEQDIKALEALSKQQKLAQDQIDWIKQIIPLLNKEFKIDIQFNDVNNSFLNLAGSLDKVREAMLEIRKMDVETTFDKNAAIYTRAMHKLAYEGRGNTYSANEKAVLAALGVTSKKEKIGNTEMIGTSYYTSAFLGRRKMYANKGNDAKTQMDMLRDLRSGKLTAKDVDDELARVEAALKVSADNGGVFAEILTEFRTALLNMRTQALIAGRLSTSNLSGSDRPQNRPEVTAPANYVSLEEREEAEKEMARIQQEISERNLKGKAKEFAELDKLWKEYEKNFNIQHQALEQERKGLEEKKKAAQQEIQAAQARQQAYADQLAPETVAKSVFSSAVKGGVPTALATLKKTVGAYMNTPANVKKEQRQIADATQRITAINAAAKAIDAQEKTLIKDALNVQSMLGRENAALRAQVTKEITDVQERRAEERSERNYKHTIEGDTKNWRFQNAAQWVWAQLSESWNKEQKLATQLPNAKEGEIDNLLQQYKDQVEQTDKLRQQAVEAYTNATTKIAYQTESKGNYSARMLNRSLGYNPERQFQNKVAQDLAELIRRIENVERHTGQMARQEAPQM